MRAGGVFVCVCRRKKIKIKNKNKNNNKMNNELCCFWGERERELIRRRIRIRRVTIKLQEKIGSSGCMYVCV